MKLSKLLRFYRIKDWYYHLGLTFLGYIFIKASLALDTNLVISIWICICSLGYGYSFNDLCEKSIQHADWQKILLSLLPIFFGMLAVLFYYPGFTSPYLLAIFLNTTYSLPKTRWKTIPILSIFTNAYMFGILFLLGTYAASGKYELSSLLMCIYIGLFFIPAQLLHELSHGQKDNRYEFIKRNSSIYLSVFLVSIGIIAFFSLYLFRLLNLKIVFLTSNIFWIVIVFYLFDTDIFKKFTLEKALCLRKIFRYGGIFVGLIYFLTFYRK